MSGCAGSGHPPETPKGVSGVLAQFGDSILSRDAVVARIPPGIPADDSLGMFNAIVDDWLEGMLLGDMARRNNIDMSHIDRLVADYRNQLIISQYRERMIRSHVPRVDDAEIRRYYDQNASELLLERPAVQGVFLKAASDAPRLNDMRAWMRSCSPADIANLERYGIDNMLDYEFFADTWLDWQTVAGQFPGRLPEPASIMASGGFYHTSHDDVEYMLHISGILPEGSRMPYEFARPIIAESLAENQSADYERRLLRELCNRALRDNRLLISDSSLSRRLVR